MFDSHDTCFKFKALCDVSDEFLCRGGIRLVASFMSYLGYDIDHEIKERELDPEITR